MHEADEIIRACLTTHMHEHNSSCVVAEELDLARLRNDILLYNESLKRQNNGAQCFTVRNAIIGPIFEEARDSIILQVVVTVIR